MFKRKGIKESLELGLLRFETSSEWVGILGILNKHYNIIRRELRDTDEGITPERIHIFLLENIQNRCDGLGWLEEQVPGVIDKLIEAENYRWKFYKCQMRTKHWADFYQNKSYFVKETIKIPEKTSL